MSSIKSLPILWRIKKKYWWCIRRVRRCLPQPRFWAQLFSAAIPCSFIAARRFNLDRPESIQFSMSGEHVIVSNSLGRSLTVYEFSNASEVGPRLRLVDQFSDDEQLHYVHGAAFVDSDRRYLAVGEYANTLIAVAPTELLKETNQSDRVVWSVSGVENGLDNPADIALHPSRPYLVIANRRKTGLSFMDISEQGFDIPPTLARSINVPVFNAMNVAAPHGVAFSPDGRFLFVSHKRFAMSDEDVGNSAITVYDADIESAADARWTPLAIKNLGRDNLHHIACHPFEPLIAVTNSRGLLKVYSWAPEQSELKVVGSIDVLRWDEGAKGICFTPTGEHIAVTSELDEVLFFSLRECLT